MGRRKRNEQRRQRISQIAIGLLLVFLMVISILQVSLDQNNKQKYTFNKHNFIVERDHFKTKLNGAWKQFRFAPFEENGTKILFRTPYGVIVQFQSAPGVAQLLQQSSAWAVTFNPDAPPQLLQIIDGVRFELSREMEGMVGSGILTNATTNPDYQGFPRIDCDVATSQMPVIRLLLANMTSSPFANITLNGSCITISGSPAGLAASRDYLLLARGGVVA